LRQPEKEAAEEVNGTALSVGSRGHPNSCSKPCKYFRRKKGCRDGAACPNCHDCMWQRELFVEKVPPPPSTTVAAEIQEQPIGSGSSGHPFSCGKPCKYVRRKGGCRDGAACPNCHECIWQRGVFAEKVYSPLAPATVGAPAVGGGGAIEKGARAPGPDSGRGDGAAFAPQGTAETLTKLIELQLYACSRDRYPNPSSSMPAPFPPSPQEGFLPRATGI
jgi:hypothetical protein